MGILPSLKKKKTAAPKEASSSKTARSEKKSDAAVSSVRRSAQVTSVLVKPLVSEKSMQKESAGVYVFVVRNDANKLEVKQAVAAEYGVMPATVRMIRVQGKDVRFGNRYGRRSDWKKAVVTLPKGKTIAIHEGV